MLIPKRFIVRHKILNFLLRKQESDPNHDITKTTTPHTEIAIAEKITAEDIVKYHEVLIDNKHITCDEISSNRKLHKITLTLDGRTAALENTYLNEGILNRNNKIEFFFKTFVPIVTVTISAISLYNSCNSIDKIDSNNESIKSLQIQMQQVKDTIKQITLPLSMPNPDTLTNK